MLTFTVDPNCTRCPLADTRRQVVQPHLPPGMRVLFVGRDPGDIEDKYGTPFHPTAPAGKMLRQTLLDVGIPIEWCGFMNTVSCHTPGNRGPHLDELMACSTWGKMTLRQGWVNGAFLYVFLGAEAAEAYFNLEGYKQSRVKAGKGMYPLADWHGKVVLTTGYTQISKMVAYHPSAALRSNEMRRLFVGDMKQVARLLGVVPATPTILPLDPTTIDRWQVLAFDTETPSLTNRTLLGIGIVVRQPDGLHGLWCSQQNGQLGIGIDILHRHRGRVIMHNMKFDHDVMEQAELILHPGRCHDVMLEAYTLRREIEVGSLGLKELALADLGLSWTTLSEMGQSPEELSDEELGEYCLYDAGATFLLDELYMPQLGAA